MNHQLSNHSSEDYESVELEKIEFYKGDDMVPNSILAMTYIHAKDYNGDWLMGRYYVSLFSTHTYPSRPFSVSCSRLTDAEAQFNSLKAQLCNVLLYSPTTIMDCKTQAERSIGYDDCECVNF